MDNKTLHIIIYKKFKFIRKDIIKKVSRRTLLILSFIILLTVWNRVYAQKPVSIIYDTDMASDCDDAGALAILNVLSDLGEAKILAVVTNRMDKANGSAAAVDAINTYYGRPNIPIGTEKEGGLGNPGKSSFIGFLRDEFPNDVLPDNQMPNALDIYRKTLAAQPDHSVVIYSGGLLTNLKDLVLSKPDKYSPLNGEDLSVKKLN